MIQKRVPVFSVLLICMILVFTNCKKEEGYPPYIIVQHPHSGDEFIVGDTIRVLADMSSKVDITAVKITLLNENGVPMLVPKYYFPGVRVFYFDYMFPINEELENGTYTLQVSADNEYGTGRHFSEIFISGPGKYFKNLLAVCQPNTLKTNVYTVNAEAQYEIFMDLDYGYKGSAISNRYQQFYFLRPAPDIMYAFNLDDLEVDYQVDAAMPYPQFNSIDYYDETSLVYLTGENGDIRGYNQSGTLAYQTPVNQDTIPKGCWLNDDVVFSYCERRSGPEKFLRNYFMATGVYYKGIQLDFTILDAYRVETWDKVALFGNKDLQGVGHKYYVDENIIQANYAMPEGELIQVEQITDIVYLFAAEDGIYRHNQSYSSYHVWLEGVKADVMAYDKLRQKLYVASGNNIYLYTYPGAQLLQEVILPYPVLNLHIQYN